MRQRAECVFAFLPNIEDPTAREMILAIMQVPEYSKDITTPHMQFLIEKFYQKKMAISTIRGRMGNLKKLGKIKGRDNGKLLTKWSLVKT